jgi:hypothetical protein
MNIMH